MIMFPYIGSCPNCALIWTIEQNRTNTEQTKTVFLNRKQNNDRKQMFTTSPVSDVNHRHCGVRQKSHGRQESPQMTLSV